MSKLKLVTVLTAIITLLGVGSQAAHASSSTAPLVVILADRYAVDKADGGLDLMRSFVALTATLRQGQEFVFIGADEPTTVLGPLLSRDAEFRRFRREIGVRMSSDQADPGPNMVSAVAETFNYLGSQRAARGSTVYLVAGGTVRSDMEEAGYRLRPTTSMFEGNGWSIVGLSLPGAAPEIVEFLNTVSINSGGEFVPLSVPDGLTTLSSRILKDEAKGALAPISQTVLSSDSMLTSTVDIAPGTSETTLIFFKEDRFGSFRLSNPLGLEASIGDRSASSVVETPHVVIWRLTDPAAGDWKVDVRGVNGVVSAWRYGASKYGVSLNSPGSVSLNEPTSLVAYVTDNGDMITADGVSLVARITSPGGETVAYELNDAGTLGDATAMDGYFSAAVSPLTTPGEYTVELELSWQEFAHKITSHTMFRGQHFPRIVLTGLQTEELDSGARTKVASMQVQVGEQMYALPADQLLTSVVANDGQPGTVEVVPRRALSDGRAWLYDVYFTPEDGIQHSMSFELSIEYAGRQYTFMTEPLVVSSLAPEPVHEAPETITIPAPPVVIVTVPAPLPPSRPELLPTSQPAKSTPSIPLTARPLRTFTTSSGQPWALYVVPGVLLVVLAAAAAFWITRARPYGYLYNDRGEPVVDFAGLHRRPLMRFVFKNSVFGKELGLPGLEGVSFKFFRRRIGLRTARDAPTVRVNNQPVVEESAIRDRTWIGAHGKLYSFLLSQLLPSPEPGTADD